MGLRRPSRTDVILTAVTLGSVVALGGALLLTRAGAREWGAGVLVNIGATMLLVLPIYWLNKRLDDRIERVRVETRSSVDALTNRVVSFEEDVERRLEDVADSVSARLQEERRQDANSFDALTETPSRDVVFEALRRANELGLIMSGRGPRMCVSEDWRIYVRVNYDEDPGEENDYENLVFAVQSFSGESLDMIPWPADQNVDEIMFRIGRSVEQFTSDETFDVRGFLRGLRDTLAAAQSHPDRRPVLQLCPPQWLVTPTSLVTYGERRVYEVSLSSLRRDEHLATSIGTKPWVDTDSFAEAQMAGEALHRQSQVPLF